MALKFNIFTGTLDIVSAAGGGVSDHGALTGLADDDHAQYALLAGRSGGQVYIGGSDSGNDLTLASTAHATKGSIFLGTGATSLYDETNDRLGINETSPLTGVHISGDSGPTSIAVEYTPGAWAELLAGSDAGIFTYKAGKKFGIAESAGGRAIGDSFSGSYDIFCPGDRSTIFGGGVSGSKGLVEIQGSLATARVAKTGTYTLTKTDSILEADASGGDFTLTLPTAVGAGGRRYTIINTSSGNTTVDGSGSQTIDGATTVALGIPSEAITIVSDNANWEIESHVYKGHPVVSVLPATPYDGQTVIHAPTGRKVLMVYESGDAAWKPILSMGTITVYVDATDGADTAGQGTGVDGAAFATVPYALESIIPGNLGGDVDINVNEETYGIVALTGKKFSANYELRIHGTPNVNKSFTGTGGTTGSGSTQGTVTGTFTLSAHVNMIIKCLTGANAGVFRVVDSNTTGAVTIGGTWPSTPLNGDTYEIYDNTGTTFTTSGSDHTFNIFGGQKGVVLNDIHFNRTTNGYNFRGEDTSVFIFNRCFFTGSGRSIILTNSEMNEFACIHTEKGSSRSFRIITAQLLSWYSKYVAPSASEDVIVVNDFSRIQLVFGTIIDGGGFSNVSGIQLSRCSLGVFSGFGIQNKIRNCGSGASGGIGLELLTDSHATNTSGITNSGNDANSSTDAESSIA